MIRLCTTPGMAGRVRQRGYWRATGFGRNAIGRWRSAMRGYHWRCRTSCRGLVLSRSKFRIQEQPQSHQTKYYSRNTHTRRKTDKLNGIFQNTNSVPNSETQCPCHQLESLNKPLFANSFAIFLSVQSEVRLGDFTHELAHPFTNLGNISPCEETSFWAALVPSVSDIISRYPEQTS